MKSLKELIAYDTRSTSFIIVEWITGKREFRCDRPDLEEAVSKCIEKYEKAGLSFTVRKETNIVEYLYNFQK